MAWSRVAAACYSARLTGAGNVRRAGGWEERKRGADPKKVHVAVGLFVTQGVRHEHFWQVLSRCDLLVFRNHPQLKSGAARACCL